MVNKVLAKICLNKEITLTSLRADVLEIIYAAKSPLGAYDILKQLKVDRPSAEPPTVYRVLDFLIQAKLIHRIESQNTYVFCAHLSDSKKPHLAILFICKRCKQSVELEGKTLARNLMKLAENHSLKMDHTAIEMQGTCKHCHAI